MAWTALLRELEGLGEEGAGLLERVRLDLQGHKASDAYTRELPGLFGDHIDSDLQAATDARVTVALRVPTRSGATRCEQLEAELRDTFLKPSPAFADPSNAGNQCSAGRCVRYTTLRSFLTYILNVERVRIPDGKSAGCRAAVNDLFEERLAAERAHPRRLVKVGGAHPVWAAPDEGPRPHDGASADAAREVVRRLALSGFTDPDDRLLALGMVALVYDAPGPMWRPTAADAWTQPWFFPGPRDAHKSGCTRPLNPDLDAFATPYEVGVREWIHLNDPVPFDPSDAGTVAWYGFFAEVA